MEIECLKSAARLLDRNCVYRGGLDLSKEALCVSVGQMAAELPAIKVGDLNKNSAAQPSLNLTRPRRAERQNNFSTFNFDSW